MSGGVSWNTDFAVATTDHYLDKTVRDQVFDKHGLLGWIEQKVGFDRISGGDNILVPLGTAIDTNGGSYSGYDTFDTDPSDTLGMAYYTWKQYQQPVTALAFEILRNSSAERQIDVWMNKVDIALRSLRDKLNTDAFAATVGNGGKNIQGLGLLVDAAGVVGGLNRSTATYWQANEQAVSGALAIDTSVGMLRMFNNCSTGSGDSSTPDAIWTTQIIYEAYENLLAPDIRHTSRSMGDGTFSGLGFKGVPLAWDADCASGLMYFLRSETFSAWIHPERDFKHTEIAKADNGTLHQDAYISHILLWPEFAINEPRRNGKLTGITNS